MKYLSLFDCFHEDGKITLGAAKILFDTFYDLYAIERLPLEPKSETFNRWYEDYLNGLLSPGLRSKKI